MTDIDTRVIHLIAQLVPVKEQDIKPAQRLRDDLGMDSVSSMELHARRRLRARRRHRRRGRRAHRRRHHRAGEGVPREEGRVTMRALGSDPGSEVVDALLEQTSRFCAREIDAQAIDATARIPPSVLSGLAELGLFGVTLPEAHGGAGLSLGDACRVVDVLARFDRSVAVSVGLHLGLGTRGLVRFGTAAQHTRWLPSLASGACIAAFSTTEPGAGSDLSALRTIAREDGEHFVVSGEKSYVTNGAFAGLFTVAVSTPGLGGAQRGQSLLLVEPTDAGFSVQREEHKLGLKGSSTTGLLFEDARLERARLLGEPGQAHACCSTFSRGAAR